jgi:hypothetical protein
MRILVVWLEIGKVEALLPLDLLGLGPFRIGKKWTLRRGFTVPYSTRTHSRDKSSFSHLTPMPVLYPTRTPSEDGGVKQDTTALECPGNWN